MRPNTGYRVFLGDKEFRARTPETTGMHPFVTGGDMMHSSDWHKDGVRHGIQISPFCTVGEIWLMGGKSWEQWLDWIEVYADHAVTKTGTLFLLLWRLAIMR